MNLQDIESMTIEYGEGWGITHVRRVLGLTKTIGEGLTYNRPALQYAVYLHDWGAFPRYRQIGVDHALRSRQVAEELLPRTDLSPDAIPIVLDAIASHDYRCTNSVHSTEALLLREADWLDMLGIIGIAREFAWGPNKLELCARRIRSRMNGIAGRFTLPYSKTLAEVRLIEMQNFLQKLDQESQGNL